MHNVHNQTVLDLCVLRLECVVSIDEKIVRIQERLIEDNYGTGAALDITYLLGAVEMAKELTKEKDSPSRIADLEAALGDINEQRGHILVKIRQALDKIGIPSTYYPTNVANAYDILKGIK